MMKIDMFTHFAPERLVKGLAKYESKGTDSKRMTGGISTMFDLEKRLRMIEKHEGYTQVVSIGGGPIEAVAKGQDAIDLAKIANDCAAELCMKYPMHFLAGVGALPLNDTDASLKEIDRAINDLKLKGFMIHTPLFSLAEGILPPGQGKPLDSPELIPIYEKMAQYDLPIWIHPFFENVGQVAQTEKQFSGYRVFTGKEDPAWAIAASHGSPPAPPLPLLLHATRPRTRAIEDSLDIQISG